MGPMQPKKWFCNRYHVLARIYCTENLLQEQRCFYKGLYESLKTLLIQIFCKEEHMKNTN
jgi:hypothetical protein